jgi:hypothetical protein
VPKYDVPKHLLTWRAGMPITDEHRKELANFLARTRHYNKKIKKSTLSDEELSPNMAIFIATVSGMDLETFIREFPTIAGSDNSMVRSFIRWNF